MSQLFILNDERLMGQSNHRMSVAAEKGVDEGTASPLIFLSLGDEAKEKGSDLTKRDPCRQSKDFNNEKKRGGISLLSPRGTIYQPLRSGRIWTQGQFLSGV